MPADFRNYNVVVTGASRGLGAATAFAFARRGARLALLARSEEGLRQTAAAITADGAESPLLCPGDLGDPHAAESVAGTVLESFPQVDVLVNNAAGWAPGRLADVSGPVLAETVASTLTAPLLLTRALLPGLCRSERACVINVASTAALTTPQAGGSTVFTAAKRGMVGFADALRAELRPAGVRVSTVFPGTFQSESPPDADWRQVLQRYGPGVMGVGEVTEAILYCASRPPTAAVESLVIAAFSRA